VVERIESGSGLRFSVGTSGAVHRIDHDDVTLNLFPGNDLEAGPANLYLRRIDGPGISFTPMLGPRSPAAVRVDGESLRAAGEWQGVRFHLSLRLAVSLPAWFWHVELENFAARAIAVDLVYVQDLALAHYGALRNNEYYLSQYVDYTPLDHPQRGTVLAVRQNLPMAGRHPWAVLGSLDRSVSYATDGIQVYGVDARVRLDPAALAMPRLPGTRRQHEHSMAALQDEPVVLEPGQGAARGFFGRFVAHHAGASSPGDLACVDETLALPQSRPDDGLDRSLAGERASASRFAAGPLLATRDLEDGEIAAYFDADRRHAEARAGTLLSFFSGIDCHVVLRAKEVASLRQHGHILRTGAALGPDEAALSSTAWMNGTFNSLLTQGHCNINRFLSTARGYLGIFRANGQRIFVELENGFHLLDVPSAFEMSPSRCRWIYRYDGGCIEVCSTAPLDRHSIDLTIRVLQGRPHRFLLSHHVVLAGDDADERAPVLYEPDAHGVTIRPPADSEIGRRFPNGSFRIQAGEGAEVEEIGDDAPLFVDGRSRGQPYVTLRLAPTSAACVRIVGRLIDPPPHDVDHATEHAIDDRVQADRFWQAMTARTRIEAPPSSPLAGHAERLGEILPWLAHNAMIHYLAPHGLEQYSNGGWGTRDVSQGPVELFLALERYDATRDLLLRTFRAQNPDGDWPQWFMFFDRERGIRAPDSHGDIVFWPVLALAQYLLASDDFAVFDETLPFFDAGGDARAEHATLAEHVERALGVIARRVIPGTHLAAYGHGDWNDSLQPADPTMHERLCSAWTVTLHRQTLVTLAAALSRAGRDDRAAALTAQADRVLADFQRVLIVDGALTGFAYFHEDGRVQCLLHPRDEDTGIRRRLLPTIHAIINDMLTPEQARAHVAIITKHLLGPDGARLFDRPPTYRGGFERHFRRAESSSFFGREIGVMYMHAHLRYAEAMAHYGAADALFLALRQMNPILLQETVPTAALRQSNCYHSSSDAVFADRYEASARYDDLKAGRVVFEGGWRVYSSGAGIASRLVRQCFLGLRASQSTLVIDPVIPVALDGLCVETDVFGARMVVRYRTGRRGAGTVALLLNGRRLEFARERNPYRTGGARVPASVVKARLADGVNDLGVELE
jgi:cellobiose phosphorylase